MPEMDVRQLSPLYALTALRKRSCKIGRNEKRQSVICGKLCAKSNTVNDLSAFLGHIWIYKLLSNSYEDNKCRWLMDFTRYFLESRVGNSISEQQKSLLDQSNSVSLKHRF